jgi:hypothetical protein
MHAHAAKLAALLRKLDVLKVRVADTLHYGIGDQGRAAP